MKNAAAGFGVNTYSYIFDGSAADTVARLADQGYGGVELMFLTHRRSAACVNSAKRGCGWGPSTCRMSI